MYIFMYISIIYACLLLYFFIWGPIHEEKSAIAFTNFFPYPAVEENFMNNPIFAHRIYFLCFIVEYVICFCIYCLKLYLISKPYF